MVSDLSGAKGMTSWPCGPSVARWSTPAPKSSTAGRRQADQFAEIGRERSGSVEVGRFRAGIDKAWGNFDQFRPDWASTKCSSNRADHCRPNLARSRPEAYSWPISTDSAPHFTNVGQLSHTHTHSTDFGGRSRPNFPGVAQLRDKRDRTPPNSRPGFGQIRTEFGQIWADIRHHSFCVSDVGLRASQTHQC